MGSASLIMLSRHGMQGGPGLEIAKMLIKSGADIEISDNDGWTPLHQAAYKGHIEIVKLLIENGADASRRGDEGESPLDVVSKKR